MKKHLLLFSLVAFAISTVTSNAATFLIDLSPASGIALNSGSTTYTQDHGIALTGTNTSIVTTATGDEVFSGITFDDVTKELNFDIAYGSAHGFVDLGGDYTNAHFHGPAAVQYPSPNTGAGAMLDLNAFHTASGTRSGRFTGTWTLSAGEEADLFDNEIYINVHSTLAPGGEIRAQLIPVPEPSTTALLLFCGALLGLQRKR